MKRHGISRILHSIFSDDAIKSAAICEQVEDIRYCIEHKMNHLNGGEERRRWNQHCKKAERFAMEDQKKGTTFTAENMDKFRLEADKYLKEHPNVELESGLSEIEIDAVHWMYFRKSRH